MRRSTALGSFSSGWWRRDNRWTRIGTVSFEALLACTRDRFSFACDDTTSLNAGSGCVELLCGMTAVVSSVIEDGAALLDREATDSTVAVIGLSAALDVMFAGRLVRVGRVGCSISFASKFTLIALDRVRRCIGSDGVRIASSTATGKGVLRRLLALSSINTY